MHLLHNIRKFKRRPSTLNPWETRVSGSEAEVARTVRQATKLVMCCWQIFVCFTRDPIRPCPIHCTIEGSRLHFHTSIFSLLNINSVLVLDSFPKFPESILYGNFYQLGNFDECIEAKSSVKTENDISKNTITGQYCLADIHFSRKLETKVRIKRSMENMALEVKTMFI